MFSTSKRLYHRAPFATRTTKFSTLVLWVLSWAVSYPFQLCFHLHEVHDPLQQLCHSKWDDTPFRERRRCPQIPNSSLSPDVPFIYRLWFVVINEVVVGQCCPTARHYRGVWFCNTDTRLRAGEPGLPRLRTQGSIISWRFPVPCFFERLFSICISWRSLRTLIDRSWFCSVIHSFVCLVPRRFVPLRILSLANYSPKYNVRRDSNLLITFHFLVRWESPSTPSRWASTPSLSHGSALISF
jgi:hypothetical protein